MRTITLLGLAGLLAATPALATKPTPTENPTTELGRRLMEAVKLPEIAERTREAGVPAEDVKEAIDAMAKKETRGDEATAAMTAAAEATKVHGPVDNFGAFVQEKLDAGLRGKELAQAIREEHAARGTGRPDHAGGKPEGAGQPDHAGKADHSAGKDDHAGGKPDHVGGKPEQAGGKPDQAGGAPDHAGGKPDHAGSKGKN